MCPFGTGTAEASGEGERPVHTLKNCAKTAAKNNVRDARGTTSFRAFIAALWPLTRLVPVPHACCKKERGQGWHKNCL